MAWEDVKAALDECGHSEAFGRQESDEVFAWMKAVTKTIGEFEDTLEQLSMDTFDATEDLGRLKYKVNQ